MESPNEFDHYPYFVSLAQLDEFMMGRKPMLLKLDHEAFIKSVSSNKMKQNPSSSFSSSSSSSSIVVPEKPAVDGDDHLQIQNPFLPPLDMCSSLTLENYMMRNGLGDMEFEEEFLQNPAPLMAKIDEDYMNWQQREMVGSMQQLLQGSSSSSFQGLDQNYKVMDLENLDKMSVTTTTTQVVEKSADFHFEAEKNQEFGDERVTNSVDRRQKRMIKNRESAARSRARKQAYIEELEEKVEKLRETNDSLIKRKEAIAIVDSCSISEPRYQLRRTSSSPF